MFLKSVFLKVAPRPVLVARFLGKEAAGFYGWWLADQREALAKWHRTELVRLDPVFALRERSDELCRRRAEAEAQGIGPSDPRYPDIFDVRPLTKIE